MPIILDAAVVAQFTDDELDEYIAYLADTVDSNVDSGEWALQGRQQVAEDFLTGLEPGMFHELLYGGAVGGGKTDFLLWHHYDQALRFPNYHGLYLRKTFPMLQRSAILRSLERFSRDVARYNATEHVWKFKNGSRLEFGYLEADNDVFNYLSAEYDCIAFDELTQFPTAMPYTYLISRLRTSITKSLAGLVPHVASATNPGGVGGAWVKGRFVDIAPPETRVVQTDERGNRSSRVFVPAKLADNRYIDADTYRAALGHLPDDTRQALEDGSWDVVEGQFFTDWDRDVHVVDPFPIPPHWHVITGIDYGYANPFCGLFGAFDGDGTCYIYREHYGTGLTPPQQARRMVESRMAGEPPPRFNVIDPSTFAKTGIGVPIAQQYQDAGLKVVRGLNARVAGWQRVAEFLRPSVETVDSRGEVVFRPRLYVFTNCLNLIRTLPLLIHDDKNPEDVNTDGEDHAADALRYLLMSRPGRTKPKTYEENTREAKFAASKRRRDAARRGGNDHPILGRV